MTGQSPLHHDDIYVDTALARRLVTEQFPRWAELPLQRIASSGTVNAIFRLGQDLVLRIPRAESYVWDRNTLESTHGWLRWAAPELPVAIPEPVAIGEASEAYPWPWPVHRWFEGTSLDKVDLRHSTTVAVRLAAFVHALHQLRPVDGPRSYKAIPRETWDPQFRTVLADLNGLIDTSRAIEAWEITMQAASWSGPFPWTHADLLPGNLVVAGNGDLVAVLDFECLGIGDPALDISAAWALFDQPTRLLFRTELGVDDDTWLRAANLALRHVMGIRYYQHTNPAFAEMSTRTVTEVLDDLVPHA